MGERRTCSRCELTKSLIDFAKDSATPSGYSRWCRTCAREYQRQWRKNNPERCRAFILKHIAKNPADWVARARAWNVAHPERVRENNRVCRSKRRARKRLAGAMTLTAPQWREIKRRHRGRCYWCRQRRELTIDHVIPLSRGGQHVAENIVASCLPCNLHKHAKVITLF